MSVTTSSYTTRNVTREETVKRETVLLMAFRAALLAMVDAIEVYLGRERTKDLRKTAR